MIRVLLLLQVGFASLSTLEAVFMGLVTGGIALLAPVVAATGLGAAVLLVAASRLERRSRWARRVVLWWEWLLLVTVAVDLVLSLVLARASLDLVPLLTRLVMPVALLRLLRRPRVASHANVPALAEPVT